MLRFNNTQWKNGIAESDNYTMFLKKINPFYFLNNSARHQPILSHFINSSQRMHQCNIVLQFLSIHPTIPVSINLFSAGIVFKQVHDAIA